MDAPKKSLQEVFKTVGLPPYTYVKPKHYGEVKSDVLQPGRHVLIEGPSGVGKTCVVFKVFEEKEWIENKDYSYFSGRQPGVEEKVRNFLDCAINRLPLEATILVIDDFHLMSEALRAEVGSKLKQISDLEFLQQSPPKMILIGIPTTGASVLANAKDLGPRLGSYRFDRADEPEINQLISEGEYAMNVLFEDKDLLLKESAGNFWLAQYICNKVCATQDVQESQQEVKILTFDLLNIRKRLMVELSSKFMNTAATFAKGKKWRPGGNKPYLEVLIALMDTPASVVTYDKILNAAPDNRRQGIKNIKHRISEVIYDQDKEIDLRKQIAFDPSSGFTIEDPLFRYFLSNLDRKQLYAELGVEQETIERMSNYSFDIGFSFSGEVRRLVEIVNTELQKEHVYTFYDFDKQAVLLGLDLEEHLGKIYREACRYYLVFMDRTYRSRIWTKFEKDALLSSGRKYHFIPVIVDDEGLAPTAGVSTTLARIDLRDAWRSISSDGLISDEVKNLIRNRCVLPMIEKLDDSSEVPF